MKHISVALVALFAVGALNGSPCIAQTRDELYHVSFAGDQLQQIFQAWQALRSEYEPDTPLSAFNVSVANGRDATTVDFLRKPTITHNADGSDVIHGDSRYYRVVLHGSEIRIIPGWE